MQPLSWQKVEHEYAFLATNVQHNYSKQLKDTNNTAFTQHVIAAAPCTTPPDRGPFAKAMLKSSLNTTNPWATTYTGRQYLGRIGFEDHELDMKRRDCADPQLSSGQLQVFALPRTSAKSCVSKCAKWLVQFRSQPPPGLRQHPKESNKRKRAKPKGTLFLRRRKRPSLAVLCDFGDPGGSEPVLDSPLRGFSAHRPPSLRVHPAPKRQLLLPPGRWRQWKLLTV